MPLPVTEFENPDVSLGGLDSGAVATLLRAAADVVLVFDRTGILLDMATADPTLARDFLWPDAWRGRPWIECVTDESKPKVEAVLAAIRDDRPSRQIQLNHPVRDKPDIPIRYTLCRLGRAGNWVALGRDLRPESLVQQQLVDAQQTLERDYLRLRQVETRYRLLFELSGEAVLVLDPATQKIIEANPAARLLLSGDKALPGRGFLDLFDPLGAQSVLALLTLVRAAGRAEDVEAHLFPGGRPVTVSASLFRQENASLFLIRLAPVPTDREAVAPAAVKSKLLLALESAPDGFVVADSDARIVAANAAFLDMIQLASEEQVRSTPLQQWLGRTAVDLGVLTTNLAQWGSVRLFATTLRGAYGASTEVEISAGTLKAEGRNWFGFAIRDVGRRLPVDSRVGRELPRSVEQLTELIGRVSLKDLVREATDMIERLGIEAALELTNDNRASAAELLGLSRQSLYLKLRRHGLGDLGPEPDQKH
jgi:transcriptional regulator PpsR